MQQLKKTSPDPSENPSLMGYFWNSSVLLGLLSLLLSASKAEAGSFWPPAAFAVVLRQHEPVAIQKRYPTSLSSTRRNENERAQNLAQQKSQQQQWRTARVISSRPACPSGKSTIIQLDVDNMTRQEYTTPGQFIQLRPKDSNIEPIFLAMSSAPTDDTSFEFLVKMAPRLTWLPETLKVNSTLQLSQVMGDGFSIPKQEQQGVLLAAAGSGIAPLKACIETEGFLPNSHHTLYYGEWTQDDLCFTELFDSWKTQVGLTVVPVLSRAEANDKVYVQDILKKQNIPKSTMALLCGMDDMIESCTDVLTNAGVDKDRILLNL